MQLLQELVISEMVEGMVPLCYLVCFSMAYYGPNGELFGNILNSYWHFSAVEDPTHTIKNVCIFFLIDTLSLVLCALLLWYCCQINLYKAYVALQKEFGMPFNVALAYKLNGYFLLNMIAAGMDLTLEFKWIHGDYNYTEPISTSVGNF